MLREQGGTSVSDFTLIFERDDNDGQACIDYAWIASGKRSQLIINQGQRNILKTDTIPVDQTIVNVFALTNKNIGLAAVWPSDPSQLAIKFASEDKMSSGQFSTPMGVA
jgi:hypothetical protein